MADFDFAFTLNCFMPLAVALCVTAVLTRALIPYLKRLGTTQTIHEDVPGSHQRKAGTPVMGGAAILAGAVCGGATAMAIVRFSANFVAILLVALIFGFVGFLDDRTKVLNRRNLGLTAKKKILLQILISLAFAIFCVFVSDAGTTIIVPFVWKSVDIGFWMIPYIAFITVAMVNSVNLTDGLDGLAGGVTAIMSLFFPSVMVLTFAIAGRLAPDVFATMLLSDRIIDILFFPALAGACIGFLIYNRHPAKIFMGDTGSLAIGGGVAAAAILTHTELFLPIMGLVFVAEALSDIIQVASYKLRKGKRVFKMAPLHHHFELSGWSERRIVFVFSGITLALCAITVSAMILQAMS
ncbi:MAG: phospho-N-acetylmuramoyl-pentapeptide-transferase [Clostridiales Family XIII bacterium]|jgi:phospho-N-acetylmuramoyl-pentapeptide-transferase|nr:phospho-N-acetylmuramoyl-pentapeptide-transferase [Clostridiales Family XIII bacterium]